VWNEPGEDVGSCPEPVEGLADVKANETLPWSDELKLHNAFYVRPTLPLLPPTARFA